MGNDQFFSEIKEQSYIKVEIVAKYFGAWAKIMAPRAKKIAYLDLFSGPGRYRDGSKSTPLLILEHAINNEKVGRVLISVFNDIDRENTETLQKEINALSGIDTLRYRPKVYNGAVDTEFVEMIEEVKSVPTLLFADPWGYKELSLQLIKTVLRNWGCDCIFFFNYNRINMALANSAVAIYMEALFGEQRASELRQQLERLSPHQREQAIVEAFVDALKEIGGTHVLPFAFKNDRGTRTTHHLIFVSKHPLAYKIMKDIMARTSSNFEQGIASFEYNPAEIHSQAHQLLLFEEFYPLNGLEDALLHDFAGQRVTVEQTFRKHHLGRLYVEKNYKDAFRNLEAQGKIVADTPADRRKKRRGRVTVNGVLFTFPPNLL
jgi:three-Cys-motif partner protein